MNYSDVFIKPVVLNDIEENCYIVARNGASECVVIDPGMDPEPLLAELAVLRLVPRALLVTHGHWDHIGGVSQVRDRWSEAQIYIGENEHDKLKNPEGNLSAMFGLPLTTADADVLLKDGQEFELLGMPFRAIEIPGHTSGHMVYFMNLTGKPVVFCGDVVFANSIGRSDMPDGNPDVFVPGIKRKLLTLPEETLIMPGHGPATSVAMEKRWNPFLS